MATTDVSSVLNRLDAVKDTINVQRAFGEPYVIDGVTVIPVAKVGGGGGGGAGEGAQPEQKGSGTGAGMAVVAWAQALPPTRRAPPASPHAAPGVSFEDVTNHSRPIILYDDPAGGPRVVRPEHVDGPHADVLVSPFVSAGFKAYLTQHGFFRSDLKVTLRDGVDEVLLRFGFGVDF